jgi:serine/threonine protein kinase
MFAVGVLAYHLLTGEYPFDAALFDDEPGENVVGGPKMEAIRESLCSASVSWSHDAFCIDAAARSLWESALAVDATLRPTALQALADPWLAPAAFHDHSLTPLASRQLRVEYAPVCLLETKASSDIWQVPAQPEEAWKADSKAITRAHECDDSPPIAGVRREASSDIWLVPSQTEEALQAASKAMTGAHERDGSPPRSGALLEEIADIPLPPGCIDTD